MSKRLLTAIRVVVTAMAPRPITLGLGVAAALAAAGAFAADPISRALAERQQQSDAFALQLQQSLQSSSEGNLGPRERLELDAIQRSQRQRQDELFYRQQVEANSPSTGAMRSAEAIRAEQERQQQLSRFRSEPVPGLRSEAAGPLVDPSVVTAPIARLPADAMAALDQGADPARAAALAEIRLVEERADALWQAALQADWSAAQDALEGLRRSVDALRGPIFAANYSGSGGSTEMLSGALAQLDAAIAGAERQMGAQDAASVMRRADEAMLAGGALTPALEAPVTARDDAVPGRW